jgi:hypothetical protein
MELIKQHRTDHNCRSKRKDGKKTILEYQNLLLAEFAHKNNTEA